MNIKELRALIDRQLELHPEMEDVKLAVVLSMSSMGGCAKSEIVGAQFGFDWDRGFLIFRPKEELSHKTENEAIFQAGRDILGWIATKPAKKQSYEQRTALRVFERLEYDIMKYQKIFHHDA